MPLGLVPAMTEVHTASQVCGAKMAPPKGFRGAVGVRHAWRVGEPPFSCTPARSAAQRAGKRYEKAAQGHLASLLGGNFTSGQWFKYFADGPLRYCQVDGLLYDDDGAVIFEIKYTYSADAYWQLRKLYEPVVRCALSPKRLGLVVVCRSFDPAAAFPEAVQHTELLSGWRENLTGIEVFQWRA